MTYFNKAGPQLAQKQKAQKAHGKRSITRIKAQLQTGASSGMTWPEFLTKSLSSSFWWQTELLLMSSEQVGTQEEQMAITRKGTRRGSNMQKWVVSTQCNTSMMY